MPESYITLFDSVFLPQGLALYHSLLINGGEFRLWVLCLDQQCFDFLDSLKLEHLSLLNLTRLETQELLAVKNDRSRAEYCWTLTPWSIQWVFETDITLERVTYLDADTFFLSSPASIFTELDTSGKSFLITEHGYSPHIDQSDSSGRFCVQFVSVSRGRGEQILHWWRDRCLECCSARPYNGLFGDQKYFETLADIFSEDVFIIRGDGRFLAPWNCEYYRYSDALIYHFHGLRILSTSRFLLSSYNIPEPVLSCIYKPYVLLIQEIYSKYPRLSSLFKPQVPLNLKIRLGLLLGTIKTYVRRLILRIPCYHSFNCE